MKNQKEASRIKTARIKIKNVIQKEIDEGLIKDRMPSVVHVRFPYSKTEPGS